MLDLPGYPLLDKRQLIGGCIRLAVAIDTERLQREFQALPASVWGTTGGRVGVHNPAEAVFLRGYAPAEGEKPIEDRPALDFFPYARYLIEHAIPATAFRCLLAKLPAGANIAPHIDRAPYFSKTLRVHIPIETHENAWMMCDERDYQMQAGEVWVINNSTVHAVWNSDTTRSRTHMICDFVPSEKLTELIEHGERNLAVVRVHG
jgi:hypothetical protein